MTGRHPLLANQPCRHSSGKRAGKKDENDKQTSSTAPRRPSLSIQIKIEKSRICFFVFPRPPNRVLLAAKGGNTSSYPPAATLRLQTVETLLPRAHEENTGLSPERPISKWKVKKSEPRWRRRNSSARALARRASCHHQIVQPLVRGGRGNGRTRIVVPWAVLCSSNVAPLWRRHTEG